MKRIFLTLVFTSFASSLKNWRCDVRTRIDSGWVCGLKKQAENNVKYASFRGIPYAKQPVGELRFKELEPLPPWKNHMLALEEGPICPQYNEVYYPERGMSEACISVNVYVPWNFLNPRYTRRVDYDYNDEFIDKLKSGAPIFVFIHGGSFVTGSGDSDLYGPEYLVSKGVIVITFNYRLNVFGFLSLNNTKIPGNNGLRDQITLLHWVQRNARAFGGDPNDVTLAGLRSGATCAHLLTISPAAQGLFKRAILMSGTAIPSFYTSSPVYAKTAASRFLALLGISNSTRPDEVYNQLVNAPLKDIMKANAAFQRESGIASFSPVVESKHRGVLRIIDDKPTNLIKQGYGKQYPLMVGYMYEECLFFKNRLTFIKMLQRIDNNPISILPLRIPYTTQDNKALELAHRVIDRYFDGSLSLETYLDMCQDALFVHPAFKVGEWRVGMTGAAPVYLYEFAYDSDFSQVREAWREQYNTSAQHVEYETYIFKENAILGNKHTFSYLNRDDKMKDWMTQLVINFMRCDKPSCEGEWYPVNKQVSVYQYIREPYVYKNNNPSKELTDTIKFFDEIDEIAYNASIMNATRRHIVNPELWWRIENQ